MMGKNSTNVDIFKFPGKSAPTGQQATIGDMHANAIKFLFFLIKEGVISFTKENYDKAVAIYKEHSAAREHLDIYFKHKKQSEIYPKDLEKIAAEIKTMEERLQALDQSNAGQPPGKEQTNLAAQIKGKKLRQTYLEKELKSSIDYLSAPENQLDVLTTPIQQQLAEFDQLINTADIQNKAVQIRLIGDELADRGVSDIFILSIYRMLKEKGGNISTLLSNHGVEFLVAYNKAKSAKDETSVSEHYTSDPLGPDQARSLYAIRDYISLGILTQQKIEKLTDTSGYLSSLKIIDYALMPNGSISLYSHAPVDVALIRSLANYLHVPFEDLSPIHLAKTIDAINTAFQDQLIKGNDLSELLERPEDLNNLTEIDKEENPIIFALWNRNYDIIYREPTHNNYSINYNHGHDPRGENNPYTFNLDNTLGKKLGDNQGTYTTETNEGFHLHQLSPEQLAIINGFTVDEAKLLVLIQRLANPPKRTGLSALASNKTIEQLRAVANNNQLTLAEKLAQANDIAIKKGMSKNPIYKEIIAAYQDYQTTYAKKIADRIARASNPVHPGNIATATSPEPIQRFQFTRAKKPSTYINEGEDPLTQPDEKIDSAEEKPKIEVEPDQPEVNIVHDLSSLLTSNVKEDYLAPKPVAAASKPVPVPAPKPVVEPKKIEPAESINQKQKEAITRSVQMAVAASTPKQAAYLLSIISTNAMRGIKDITDTTGFAFQVADLAWIALTEAVKKDLDKAASKEERVIFWLNTLGYLDNANDIHSILAINAELDTPRFSKKDKFIFEKLPKEISAINTHITKTYGYENFGSYPTVQMKHYHETPIIALHVSYYKNKMANAKEGLMLAEGVITNIDRALELLTKDQIEKILTISQSIDIPEQDKESQLNAIFATINSLSPNDIQATKLREKDKQLSAFDLAEKTKKEFLETLKAYKKELTSGLESAYDILIKFKNNQQLKANGRKAEIQVAQENLGAIQARAKVHLDQIEPQLTQSLEALKNYIKDHTGSSKKRKLDKATTLELVIESKKLSNEEKMEKLAAFIKDMPIKKDRVLGKIAVNIMAGLQAKAIQHTMLQLDRIGKEPAPKKIHPAKKIEPARPTAEAALMNFLNQHTDEEIIASSTLLKKFTALTDILTWDLNTKKIIESKKMPTEKEIQRHAFIAFEAALNNDTVFLEANYTRESLKNSNNEKAKTLTEAELPSVFSELNNPKPQPEYTLDIHRMNGNFYSMGFTDAEIGKMLPAEQFRVDAALYYASAEALFKLQPFQMIAIDKEDFEESKKISNLYSTGYAKLIAPFLKHLSDPDYQKTSVCLRELILERNRISDTQQLERYDALLDVVDDIVCGKQDNKNALILAALKSAFNMEASSHPDPKKWREEIKEDPKQHVFAQVLTSLISKMDVEHSPALEATASSRPR